MAAKAQLLGAKELEKTFRTLGERVQRKVLRQAVNAACNPVLKAARAKTPIESGLLKKALGKKTKTYTGKGTVAGIVGPRTNISGEYQGKKRVPWRYAHLAERKQPFLRPGFDESKAQALDTMKDKLAAGVVKEAKKAGGL